MAFSRKLAISFWLEKPPLLHWLEAAIVSARLLRRIFRNDPCDCPRFWPAVGVRRGVDDSNVSRRFGWFSGARVIAVFTALVQTTTVHFITYARLAEAEMLLAFFIVLALFLFVAVAVDRHRLSGIATPRSLSCFRIVVGLSNMAKGLGFGPFFILAPCAVYLIWKRDRAAWRRMISWPGLTLGLVIALAWPIAVLALRAPEFGMIWRGTIEQRALGGQYDQPWWYYFTTPPWQLLPWTPALLFAAWPSLLRAWRQPNSPDRFIWCWAIVPIVVLTFFHGKHHHYIIASLCSLSPICALGLLRAGIRWAIACVALAAGGILFVNARIMPTRDRCRDDRDFLVNVRNLVPPDVPLVATSGQEIARHIFYIEPPPQGVFDSAHLERDFAGKSFYLITRQKEETRLTKLGQVETISQSRHTRAERDPSDRFTLFKIQPRTPSPEP